MILTISDVRKAEELARTLYSDKPGRWEHIQDVVRVLREMRTTPDSRLLYEADIFVAAYVHDMLDDMVITRPELRDALGQTAMEFADALSESFTVFCGRRCTFFENLPVLRHPMYLEVRLASRFVNWRSALEIGDQVARKFYRQDYALFRSELIKLNVPNKDTYWLRLDGLMDELPEARWEQDGVWRFGIVTPGVAFRD